MRDKADQKHIILSAWPKEIKNSVSLVLIYNKVVVSHTLDISAYP